MNNIRWDGERFIPDVEMSTEENDKAIWNLYSNMWMVLDVEICKLKHQQKNLENAYELWLKESKETQDE